MSYLSLKTNNIKPFKAINKKNKIVSIVIVICITIALLAGLYNYTVILMVQEDISVLDSTNIELADTILELNEDISTLNNTNIELATKIDVLTNQQPSYDFLLFHRFNDNTTKNYIIHSGTSGTKEMKTTSLSEALKYVSNNDSKIVKFKSGIYDLDADVIFDSKSNLILDGQNSVLNLNGHTISFVSDNHKKNSNNQIKNFNLYNGTFRLEDSYGATVENVNFESSESATEVLNTNTWTEFTKFENCKWNNCQTGLTLKSPTSNGTGSYENTIIDHCSFNLTDNSVGIMVEEDAHFSNSKITNSRIWMHAINSQTQTGLHVEGKMTNTILSGLTFESFGNGTIYGIYLGESSTAFSVDGLTFIGEGYEAKIKNPNGIWIPGLFKTEPLNLTFDNSTTNSTKIDRQPLTIDSFDAIIKIENITPSEQIAVQITLNFIDHTSKSIQLVFIENQLYELTSQNLYDLYPSQNAILNIEVFAQTNLSNSETNVCIEVFGTAK